MRFINKTSDLSKYLGIKIENQALIKSISTGLIKTWAIGKKTSIKYKNLKYYLFKSNKSPN